MDHSRHVSIDDLACFGHLLVSLCLCYRLLLGSAAHALSRFHLYATAALPLQELITVCVRLCRALDRHVFCNESHLIRGGHCCSWANRLQQTAQSRNSLNLLWHSSKAFCLHSFPLGGNARKLLLLRHQERSCLGEAGDNSYC